MAWGSPGVVSVRDGFKQDCGHITQYTNQLMVKTAKKSQNRAGNLSPTVLFLFSALSASSLFFAFDLAG
jgi:hypothetical protein